MYLDTLDILNLFDFDEDEYEEICRGLFSTLQDQYEMESEIVQMS